MDDALMAELRALGVERRRLLDALRENTEAIKPLALQAVAVERSKRHVAELAEIGRPLLDKWLKERP